MQHYTYVVDLRIWHPDADPDAITAALGIEPNRTMMVGRPRQTPNGTPLEGVYRESYWNANPFQYGWQMSSDADAQDTLAELLTALEPHADYLLGLRSTGGRVLIQITSHSSRNYALEIPPEMLGACARMGISLAHDVYPYP